MKGIMVETGEKIMSAYHVLACSLNIRNLQHTREQAQAPQSFLETACILFVTSRRVASRWAQSVNVWVAACKLADTQA